MGRNDRDGKHRGRGGALGLVPLSLFDDLNGQLLPGNHFAFIRHILLSDTVPSNVDCLPPINPAIFSFSRDLY